MLRIMHLVPYFAVHEMPGGIDVHVYELAKYLLKEGFEPIIYASITKESRFVVEREDLQNKNIYVRRFPAIELSTFPLFPKRGYPLPITSFSEIIRECDVLHIHGQEFLTGFVASLKAKRLDIPIVLTIHNPGWTLEDYPFVKIIRKVFYKTIFSTTINSAEKIIIPTMSDFPILQYLTHKKIVRIPHCIDLERFDNLKKEPKYVLYLGRLEPVKGVQYFVRAIPIILKKVDVNFIIAGHGSLESSLRKFIRSKGIEDHVTFLGRASYGDVPRILAKASVFVAPGGAGLTLLEAAASRTPIVTVDNPWNLSMVDSNSVLVVKEGDIKGLASGITMLLLDKNLAENLSNKARRFIEEKRSWSSSIKQYISIYKEAMR